VLCAGNIFVGAQNWRFDELMRTFLNSLVVVVLVLILFALPNAVIETFGPKARNLALPFYMILAVFSVALLVWGLVKYRLFRSGDALKSSKREHEGDKNDVCPKRGQQLNRVCSAVVAESILQNNRKRGFDD
jgi:hypothetical protein